MHPLTVEQQRRKDAPQKARRDRRQSPRRNPMLPRLLLIDHPNRPDSVLRVHRRQRTPSPSSEAITDNLTSTSRRTVHGLHHGGLQELGRPLSLHQALECSAFLTQARRSERSASLEAANTDGSSTS